MANKYFTQLNQLAAGSISAGDAMAIEDISAGETKYATASDFATYVSSNLAASSGGWDAVADTWTYLGTTSGAGTVSIPAGGTLLYGKGDKIKFTQGGTQLYFYATSVGGTTLTVTGGSDYTLGTAAITNVYYSKIENPLDFPYWFNHTVAHTGFSAAPSYISRFSTSGKACTLFYMCHVAGTSNATNYLVSLPIPAATIANCRWETALGLTYDNSNYAATGVCQIASAATTATLYKSTAAAWTNSNLKLASFQIIYEF